MLPFLYFLVPILAYSFIPISIQDSRRISLRMTVTDTPVKPIAKVPSSSWRFPPVWPFPTDFTEPVDNPSQIDRVVTSEIESRVSDHLRCYLSSDSSILELSADDIALTPSNIRFSSKELFVVKDTCISDPEIALPYPSASFDSVLISSGVEYLTDPKDLFKEVWRVLKPGGQCFVAFFSKLPMSSLRPVRMWTTMTDEQKIWIVGSYFYYSAGEGWSNIEGHDLFAESDKQLSFEKKSIEVAPYIVQAQKIISPSINENPADHVSSLLSGCRHLSPNDRKYCALRAATRLGEVEDKEEYVAMLIRTLPQIFSVLKDVQEIVVPSPVKSYLALLVAERWTNSPQQLAALRTGLGLIPAADDPFWSPVGSATRAMRPKDKIVFLADLLPLFGRDLMNKLPSIPLLLIETIAAVKAKLPEIPDEDVQLIATDLLATDFFTSAREDAAQRLLRFIASVDASALLAIKEERIQSTIIDRNVGATTL